MEFRSIDQIKSEFGLGAASNEELRRSLVKQLADMHPDKTNGEFKTTAQRDAYEKVKRALDFMDKSQSSNLVRIDDVKELIRVLRADEKVGENVIERYKSSLERSFSLSRERIIGRYRIPKLSLTTATGITTFLWAFPKLIVEHPILGKIVDPANLTFTMLWFCLVLLTGGLWALSFLIDHSEKRLHRLLSNEEFQNELFNKFIELCNADFRKNDRGESIFSKTHLVKFIRYCPFRGGLNPFSGMMYPIRSGLRSLGERVYLVSGPVDPAVAQDLAELILRRAVEKEVIARDPQKSLSDLYRINVEEIASVGHV